VLTRGARTGLTCQQTLKAAIEWSYHLLTDAERLLFGRLSVFAGGWTLASAEITCAGDGIQAEAVVELLGQFVHKSLVIADTGSDARSARFRLLETLRQYAAERLLDEPDAFETHRRHAYTFLALAEEAEPGLEPDVIAADIADDLRAALEQFEVIAADLAPTSYASGS
jgi:predicted ATPase